jgi:ATP-binding cassette subfamily B protein
VRDLARNLAVMLRASWRADRRRSIGALVTTMLLPVTRPLRAIGLGIATDGVADQDLRTAVYGGLVVAGLTGAGRLLSWAGLTIRMRLREQSILLLDEEVIELAARAPTMELHERPDHQDQMELLRTDRHYLVNPFMPVAWSVAAVVQLVTTVVVFASLHPALTLLPLAGVPALLLTLRGERWWEEVRKRTAQDYRLAVHLMDLATQPDAGKEVRVFDLGDELAQRYRQVMKRIERRHIAFDRRREAVLSAGWVLFGLAYMGAVAFVANQVVQGALSMGAVVLTLSLGAQVNGQLSELAQNATWFSRTARAAGRYRWLQDETARQEAQVARARSIVVPEARVPDVLHDGIRFERVTFAYPGTDRAVLRDVDLHLPAGATVAVVGENGAGKTTLVKLLLRLYEPTRGRITVDGVDLAGFDLAEWRAAASAAFQDFARFQFLARQSIGLSVPEATDDGRVTDRLLAEAVERAAARDLHDALPDGMATMLGREFADGIELSVGQWQKVAIARAMVRLVESDRTPMLLVLDEPTASLDAPTEHELFDHFTGVARSVSRQTGAILVSHRFSTVRAADLVVVVADNRVVEVGTHDQLLDLGGRYAELYNLQAASYR